MIEFNLLPDVKLQYIQAQRSRRLVLVIAFFVTVISVGLLVLLLVVNGLQKKHLDDLSRDISRESSKLQRQPQIGRILTVQNQLESLTALHVGKPAAPRLFGYLNQVTPAPVAITSLDIDFSKQTATITGTADALSSVNKYVDTLKFTTYKAAGASSSKAFSNVVLSAFGLTTGAGGSNSTQPATYTITLAYDKTIFDITQDVILDVPSLITTRSELDRPSDLFQAAPATSTNKGNQ